MQEAWPVVGGDCARTGHVPDGNRPTWPIEERWRHDFGGKMAKQAPVIDSRGQAFVHIKRTGVNGPNFRAIGPDGQLRWALQTNSGIGPGAPSPVIADTRAVLPDRPNAWVVNSNTGGRHYETRLLNSGVNHAVPIVADGRIHVGFRALEFDSGEQLWSYDCDEPAYRVTTSNDETRVYTSGPNGRAPAVTDGTLYVAGRMRDGVTRFVENGGHSRPKSSKGSSLVAGARTEGVFRDESDEWGHLHALDPTDGSVHWVAEFETPVHGNTPPVLGDGVVYVLDAERRLRTFDTETGEQRWSKAMDGTTAGGLRPAVTSQSVFLGSRDTLVALDGDTGAQRWCRELETDLAGPPVIVDGVIHVSDAEGTVYAVDVSGRERWRITVEGPLRTGPVVAHGRIYVAGRTLICLGSRE